MAKKIIRCWDTDNPLYIKYHDEEWGVPLHDDQKFFEFLVLGGFQAGLTWWLILSRRENFRKAFDFFEPEKVARYSEKDFERIITTPGIIKNYKKINSAINNAQCFLKIQTEYGTFDKYIWQFVNGKTIQNNYLSLKELPTETREAVTMSKDLKKRGFTFVGPTICYAFMQATGLVNDHLINCFRHKEISRIK